MVGVEIHNLLGGVDRKGRLPCFHLHFQGRSNTLVDERAHLRRYVLPAQEERLAVFPHGCGGHPEQESESHEEDRRSPHPYHLAYRSAYRSLILGLLCIGAERRANASPLLCYERSIVRHSRRLHPPNDYLCHCLYEHPGSSTRQFKPQNVLSGSCGACSRAWFTIQGSWGFLCLGGSSAALRS